MSFIRPKGSIIVGDFFTTFPANEGTISQGGIWVNGLADGTVWNNIATNGGNALPTHIMSATPPPFDDCIAHLKTSFRTFADNQFAQGTVFISGGHITGSFELEILAHFAITSNNARGYEIYWNTGQTDPNIVRWNGPLNDFDRLKVGTSAIGPPVNGDVIRVEIVGTVITVKLNTVTATSWDTSGDAAPASGFGSARWSSGQPGVGLNPFPPNGDLTTAGWQDFTCGNL